MIINVQAKGGFYQIDYANGLKARLYWLDSSIFRYYIDPVEKYQQPAQSQPDLHAQILAADVQEYGDGDQSIQVELERTETGWSIATNSITINFVKNAGTMSVTKQGQTVLQEVQPIYLNDEYCEQVLANEAGNNYFGAGTQNGRFNLTNQQIVVANTNNWVDQGVASPAPFYWSTSGYGVLRNTFTCGKYDFASRQADAIVTRHYEKRFDAIYFFAKTPYELLHMYHQLTGLPQLMPLYGFYEAHLNAYNRDFWIKADAQDKQAIKYPDGNYYREYHPKELPADLESKAIRETLNGEAGGAAYLLSARGMLDQYLNQDMPLGWFLPNDGYGAGYGQTNTLEGNLQNLAKFVTYANSKGIEVGLWTQQNLSPKDPQHPKPTDRDFEKELEVGVTALKTDMAWVGDGYSFGLNGTQTAAKMIEKIKGKELRPFIITMDGWAGTHSSAAVWTGDQKGGQWEYIRFQIPTYIGEGLSGQPNVGSDMDGIYAGSNAIVNTRDYQWKAFTPIQLNMDGWGTNPKTPFAFSDAITAINRAYLKQKTQLLPYIYSIAHQAVEDAKPMVRAMFLEYPDLPECYTDMVKYQYLWGDSFLVAPIYQNTAADDQGNDLRNGIYLPDGKQIWLDYYTGKAYQGGQVLNNFAAPVWKLPLFVKAGAIIPKAPATNTPKEYQLAKNERQFEIYPFTDQQFTVYEDDGISAKYQMGEFAQTDISTELRNENLIVDIKPTTGNYSEMEKIRTTELAIKVTEMPTNCAVLIAGQKLALRLVRDLTDYDQSDNVCYLDHEYYSNSYLQGIGTDMKQTFFRIKLAPVNVSTSEIVVKLSEVQPLALLAKSKDKKLSITDPLNFSQSQITTVTLSWQPADEKYGRAKYNVKVDDLLYTEITETKLVIEGIEPNKQHSFQVQTITEQGTIDWSPVKYF